MNNSIYKMLLDYGVDSIELTPAYPTPNGKIISVTQDGFSYEDGVNEEYEKLDADQLDGLAYEVQMQIEADEKTFMKACGI